MSSRPESEPDEGVAPDSSGSVDEALIGAHDLALAALREITPASTIGAPAGYVEEGDGVVSLMFATALPGYPGWHWTVTLARVPGEEPTVLEVELLPGEDALLAPEWVPWAVRLADYQKQVAADAVADDDADDPDSDDDAEFDDDADDDSEEESDDDDSDDDDVDDDELDGDSFDDAASTILHSGDVDGVDIDELDEDVNASDDVDDDDAAERDD